MSEPRISSSIPVSQMAVRAIQKEAAAELAMQVDSDESLNQFFELNLFNPLLQAQRFRDLKELKAQQPEKAEAKEGGEKKGKVSETAERYQKNNYELNGRTLQILRSQISGKDNADQVLQKVLAVYAESALADEALDFLLETAEPLTEAAIRNAKEKLFKERGREIKAGRNMGANAREFAKEGLGSPTSLRDLYRDITDKPREPIKLFEELTEKFRYTKLKAAITFLLHALGADLKSKGPSIQRGELKRLLDETRSLQGILGVFRFFQTRMRLVQREFASYNLLLPARLDFEVIGKVFVKILAERFMNPDKILQTAKIFGISEEVAAQMIIYSQMRDALKQVAPKYFRDQRQRDELMKAFIDALEKLEDQLEEEEEEK